MAIEALAAQRYEQVAALQAARVVDTPVNEALRHLLCCPARRPLQRGSSSSPPSRQRGACHGRVRERQALARDLLIALVPFPRSARRPPALLRSPLSPIARVRSGSVSWILECPR